MYDSQELLVNQYTGTLTISRAELSAEGSYHCEVTTRAQDPVQSQSINLNVISK